MKTNILLLAILSLAIFSCTEEKKTTAPVVKAHHLDGFLEKSKSATKEIQDSEIDVESTTKLAICLDEWKSEFPGDYDVISKESNGWEIAKKLKRNKNFVQIAQRNGFGIKSIHYIENGLTQ